MQCNHYSTIKSKLKSISISIVNTVDLAMPHYIADTDMHMPLLYLAVSYFLNSVKVYTVFFFYSLTVLESFLGAIMMVWCVRIQK